MTFKTYLPDACNMTLTHDKIAPGCTTVHLLVA